MSFKLRLLNKNGLIIYYKNETLNNIKHFANNRQLQSWLWDFEIRQEYKHLTGYQENNSLKCIKKLAQRTTVKLERRQQT
jgi:hypothetical protein